jgi:hypothetical protein
MSSSNFYIYRLWEPLRHSKDAGTVTICDWEALQSAYAAISKVLQELSPVSMKRKSRWRPDPLQKAGEELKAVEERNRAGHEALMRSNERRLQKKRLERTRECSGVPRAARPGERSWGKLLEKIKVEIATRKENLSPEDAAFFEEIYVSLPWPFLLHHA